MCCLLVNCITNTGSKQFKRKTSTMMKKPTIYRSKYIISHSPAHRESGFLNILCSFAWWQSHAILFQFSVAQSIQMIMHVFIAPHSLLSMHQRFVLAGKKKKTNTQIMNISNEPILYNDSNGRCSHNLVLLRLQKDTNKKKKRAV